MNISTTIYTRHSDWRYKSNLDFFHPSAEIVKFFDNNYEILDDSDEKIKAISVDFEGFRKLKSLQSRFETYGYCKMLNRMLSLEDLTVRKALDELSLKDVHVEETRNPHHFAVFFEGKKLTEKLGFNHLVLTPMDKYNANADSLDDTYKIFNRIIRIVGFRIVFQKPREKKISLDTKYHVQLVENRVPIRLACTALKQMEILKLEPFFTSLDDSALPKQLPKQSVQLFDSFNFRNQEVGSNLSQTAAIKSIVNRSSFPAPYVVFGPPGKRSLCIVWTTSYCFIFFRHRKNQHVGRSNHTDFNSSTRCKSTRNGELKRRLRCDRRTLVEFHPTLQDVPNVFAIV